MRNGQVYTWMFLSVRQLGPISVYYCLRDKITLRVRLYKYIWIPVEAVYMFQYVFVLCNNVLISLSVVQLGHNSWWGLVNNLPLQLFSNSFPYLHGFLNVTCMFSLHSSSIYMFDLYVFFICMYEICVYCDHILKPTLLRGFPLLHHQHAHAEWAFTCLIWPISALKKNKNTHKISA